MLPNGTAYDLRKIYGRFIERYSRPYVPAPSLSLHNLNASHWRETVFTNRAKRAFGGRESWAMSPTILQPLVKAPGRKSNAPRAARPVARIPRQALIDRRDHCMVAIARFWSQPGDRGSLFEKARQLLTRHWSAASWRARADILRTAEWLIGIGTKGADPTSIGPLGTRVTRPACGRSGDDRNRGA